MSAMEANVDPSFPGSRLDADHPENGVLIPCRFTAQQVTGTIGVLNVGGMNNDAEQQAGGVDRDMPFAALDLLRRIPAARAPFSVVFTLWVSITAALGLGSRPSRSRSITTR
jgi:hypothetical protein